MAYSEKVIDHYENPRNVGKMETDDTVGTGVVGAPACGDVMRLQIRVEEGIITDAKFKTYGCGSAIASSSLVTEWVKGKTLEQAGAIKNSEIAEELALPPTGCSGLAYVLEYVDRINDEDTVFESQDVKVIVDAKSLPILGELDVDYVRQGLNEGFEFINPNEKDRCGCGESFRI